MAWPDELKIRLELAMKTCLVSTLILNAMLLGGCGGGASSSVAESGVQTAFAGLRGTAAGGLAYGNAAVEAKCASGNYQTKTETDGSFQLSTGNTPGVCVLRVLDQANNRYLHALSNGTGTLNLTPLTELLSTRLTRKVMADVYAKPDFVFLEKKLNPSDIAIAQSEIVSAASTWFDLSKTGNWYTLNFKAATSASPNSGDNFDKALDTLKPFFTQRALLIAQDNLINAASIYPVAKEDDGFVANLNVNPASVVLSPGAKYKFTAETNYPPLVRYLRQPVKWSVADQSAGTISIDGDYIAPTKAGKYQVQVQREDYPALVQTVTVQVQENASFTPYISVSTLSLTIKPGAAFQFSANLNYPPNVQYIRPPVSWSIREKLLSGSLGSQGEFIAPSQPGIYHVVVQRDDFPDVRTEILVTVKP